MNGGTPRRIADLNRDCRPWRRGSRRGGFGAVGPLRAPPEPRRPGLRGGFAREARYRNGDADESVSQNWSSTESGGRASTGEGSRDSHEPFAERCDAAGEHRCPYDLVDLPVNFPHAAR